MTSRWSKSEEKSAEALKSSYLINYCGEVYIIDATEKEIQAALEVLKNIRVWKLEEIEKNIKEWGYEEVGQKKQSPQVQRRKNLQQDRTKDQGNQPGQRRNARRYPTVNSNVYGIYDNCVMGYITIFTEREDKVAERNFKIALTDERNIMSKSPSDYRLVKLAKFDEKTGLFENEKENIFDGVSLCK